MLEFLSRLLERQGFMPHGHCYMWRDDVLWLHLIGDGLTVLAYFLIPAMLVYFIRVRRDLRYRTIFYLFGAFIISCGTTHLISMFTVWEPVYRLESLVKFITGLVSISTTAYMLMLLPKARRIPTVEQLEGVNQQLAQEVTRHKATSEELAGSQAELTHHLRELEAVNAELEGFVYSVAHDLRAPIRHMHSYAELLDASVGQDLSEDDAFALAAIQQSARRMGTMMDELLQFSRGRNQPLRTAVVDLNELVARLQARLVEEAPGRTIRWQVAPLPAVQADPTMIEQVFDNLLSNAVKFTSQREVAEISLTVESTPEAHRFVVRDNGAGFDMKYRDKLFGLFQRLHKQSEFPGHGVGLANVKRILARHGGNIEGVGKVGEGATFIFTLPR